MSMVKIAVVQPHTSPPPDDARNVEDAVRWIGRAAGEGADFVCFPESYPGPWRMPAAYDPSARIAAAAQNIGCTSSSARWSRSMTRRGPPTT